MKKYSSLQILFAGIATFIISFFGGIYLTNAIFAFFADMEFHSLFREIWGIYLFIFFIVAVGLTLGVGEEMSKSVEEITDCCAVLEEGSPFNQ
jgi:hypothetical protein